MLDILFLLLCAIAAYLSWKALAKHLKADKKAFDQEVAWQAIHGKNISLLEVKDVSS